jgi:hypothetical protein
VCRHSAGQRYIASYNESIEILDFLLLYCDLLVTKNTCLHSVHDSQEKFHLNLEWKRNM